MESNDACFKCKYYLTSEKSQMNIGQCRRFPPAPVAPVRIEAGEVSSYEQLGAFPLVDMEDWCGEFAALGATAPDANAPNKRRQVLESVAINDAELTPRTINACWGEGIKTLWDADQTTNTELLRIPSVGEKSVRELRAVIKSTVEAANAKA